MKKNVLLLVSPLLPLVLLVWLLPQHFEGPALPEPTKEPAQQNKVPSPISVEDSTPSTVSEQLIAYAFSLIGSPYLYAGMSRKGFDCSGFTTHVFAKYNIKIPHSSRLQYLEGEAVPRKKSRPGDLVIFTGTNPDVREPGHVGIIISQPGDTIEFVHSSSNGGVKVSKVEGTRYDLRFMGVRRVL